MHMHVCNYMYVHGNIIIIHTLSASIPFEAALQLTPDLQDHPIKLVLLQGMGR